MFVHTLHGEASKNLQNALDVEYGTNSTYEHSHMPKINSSSVKICESSQKVLAQFSPASRPKILNCYPRHGLPIVLPLASKCRAPSLIFFLSQLTTRSPELIQEFPLGHSQHHLSSGEGNQRKPAYIPCRILLRLFANTLFGGI